MEQETFNKFVEIVKLHTDFEVRQYSGRGMYGKQCLGIVVPGNAYQAAGACMTLACTIIEASEGTGPALEILEHLQHAQMDNMGYDTVIYFPDVAWQEEEDEYEDEEYTEE